VNTHTNSSKTATAHIALCNVSLRLEDRSVFDGLNLDLNDRRIGLVGRNGSGKSQLLRIIAGLVAPDAGEVLVNDFIPSADRRKATREIGFVFQNPEHALLFPTVIEELRFGPVSQGHSKAEAAEMARAMLARFGLLKWEQRLVHSLSQGQKHLLTLMAACISDPQLLLLDEVFAGLDLPTERALHRLLEEMPMTQIQASHNLPALLTCDKVIWLDAGAIQDVGPAETVLAAYRAQMETAQLRPGAI
jgi:biotin transport system ATP-binding protein